MASDMLSKLVGAVVVLDTDSRLSYIGRLVRFDDVYAELDEVGVYDDREVRVSLEKFLVECAQNGVPASRGQTLIPHARVVAISPLAEIVKV